MNKYKNYRVLKKWAFGDYAYYAQYRFLFFWFTLYGGHAGYYSLENAWACIDQEIELAEKKKNARREIFTK